MRSPSICVHCPTILFSRGSPIWWAAVGAWRRSSLLIWPRWTRRQLYRREACSSMFAYATERLHLSEAEAFFRIRVARLSRRLPIVLAMLADGRLHLSGAAMLAPHLRDHDGEAWLERAAFRSKREIELLVAELAPRPDARSTVRRLPSRPVKPAAVPAAETPRPGAAESLRPGAASASQSGRLDAAAESLRPGAVPGVEGQAGLPEVAANLVRPGAGIPAVEAPRTVAHAGASAPGDASVVALSPGRFKVQFTVGEELRSKIARVQSLLRRQVPSGDLAVVFDRAMTLLLEQLERERCAATRRPRTSAENADPTPSSRHIPAAIQRAVWKRDGGQCTFRDRAGRRCSARERLEFHLDDPFARGGDHSEENLRLLCSVHNQFQAELDYGADFMAARRVRERAASYGCLSETSRRGIGGVVVRRASRAPEGRASP